MARVKFSLKRILELKEHRERVVASQLAEARAGAEAAREREDTIEAARRQVSRQGLGGVGGSPTVGYLQNVSYLLERLDDQLDDARAEVRKADAQVSSCLADFTIASQERRVLDRLRERHDEAAEAAGGRADRKTMDGIAIARFARSGRSSPRAMEGS